MKSEVSICDQLFGFIALEAEWGGGFPQQNWRKFLCRGTSEHLSLCCRSCHLAPNEQEKMDGIVLFYQVKTIYHITHLNTVNQNSLRITDFYFLRSFNVKPKLTDSFINLSQRI